MYEPGENLPLAIEADAKRLRQVLLNLLNNAVKFTETGCVTFAIKAQPLSQPHHYRLRFEVKDTGEGMAPNQQAQIFRPFEQVGDLKKQREGTGLGLAISQEIVQLMGGQLQVVSELGQGSTFWFEVEVSEATPWAESSWAESSWAESSWAESSRDTSRAMEQGMEQGMGQGMVLGYRGPKRRVLVVDDRWENRSMVTGFLEPIGFEVMEAKNGKEALAQLLQTLPDLMITDLIMPIMDGYELLKQVRQTQALKEMPTIAFSASVLEGNQHQAIEAGANAFLAKPLQAEPFLQILQSHLQLDWIYQETDGASTRLERLESNPIALPSLPVIEELMTLMNLGDIQTLIEKLEQIQQSDPTFIPFAEPILKLARSFELKQLKALIQKHLITVRTEG
jgi:CheY-like chemotaxis protein